MRSRVLALVTILPMLLVVAERTPRASAQPAPEKDLEAALQRVIEQYPEATVGVAVRDPVTGTMLSMRADRSFHAASTMKVPVLIELFRRVERGDFTLDDSLALENSFRSIVDGSSYQIGDDTDEALYERLGGKATVRDLARRMITRSSNLATNLLIEYVTPDSVQHTLRRLGADRMQVLRGVEDLKAYHAGLNNTTTARDLAVLLTALMQGRAVSPTADRAMIDILLEQTYDTMIPAGLPAGVRVAHKTGWITEIHHDAAIIYPEESEPYVLVILTEGLEERDTSARLGAALARRVHEYLRPENP